MPTVLCDILNQILKNFHAKRASYYDLLRREIVQIVSKLYRIIIFSKRTNKTQLQQLNPINDT